MGWIDVPLVPSITIPADIADNACLVGSQLAQRKALRPVLSKEQQQLCGWKMDGKPRLVRGVAGSGKTSVLAHWVQKTVHALADQPDAKVWAVYANRSLKHLIADTIEEAWKADNSSSQFPWDNVHLFHVKDILSQLLPEVGMQLRSDEFDYDRVAAMYLERKPFEQIKPRCHALFIDEAQDIGPSLLKLLSALVEQTDATNPRCRAVNIFYDNAQNIYGRGTPRWSEIGLDMRGRSTVMKESFRSTKPIMDYAVNVLYRLQPPDNDPDHTEMIERGLVERTQRNGHVWWNVRFNQVDGPAPIFRKFDSLDKQIEALGEQVVRWIRDEGVTPSDICILYNGRNIRWRLVQHVAPKLQAIGHRIAILPDDGWHRDGNAVLASTSHSYKGYDSEIVVIAGVEQFIAQEKGILANTLYVAMTRARSILAVYAYSRTKPDEPTKRLLATLEGCLDDLLERPKVEQETSGVEDFEDILESIGQEHRGWLAKLWKSYPIEQEPIKSRDGEILAEPLFWFRLDDRVLACFGHRGAGSHTLHKLEDNGIELVRPGEDMRA
jgi:hypothetical protein